MTDVPNVVDVAHIEGPEEAHCCCVPLLRGEIERLRAERDHFREAWAAVQVRLDCGTDASEALRAERDRVVRFLRSEAEWIRAKTVLHELPPHDALTIVAEAIEAGDYFVLPSTYKES